MRRQFQIIDEISGFMLDSSEEDYEKLFMEIQIMDPQEGWTRESFWKSGNGKKEYVSMSHQDGLKTLFLTLQLYEEIKKHKGGELRKFSIEIDETGTAHTKFAYSNDPPQAS